MVTLILNATFVIGCKTQPCPLMCVHTVYKLFTIKVARYFVMLSPLFSLFCYVKLLFWKSGNIYASSGISRFWAQIIIPECVKISKCPQLLYSCSFYCERMIKILWMKTSHMTCIFIFPLSPQNHNRGSENVPRTCLVLKWCREIK